MKKLTKIFTILYLTLEFAISQCIGDINTDYRINDNDLNLFAEYLLHSDDSVMHNADFDYNNYLNIFDLIAMINEIYINGNNWCQYENADLSVEWETVADSSYYDSEELESILNNGINNLSDMRGIIVIHRGKVVGEKYYNNSSIGQNFNIWSVTKSYISTLVGQAIDMGYIVDEGVMLDEVFFENNYTSQVSIAHLLEMSSGWPENWSYMNTNNILNTLLTTSLMNNPGAIFLYNS